MSATETMTIGDLKRIDRQQTNYFGIEVKGTSAHTSISDITIGYVKRLLPDYFPQAAEKTMLYAEVVAEDEEPPSEVDQDANAASIANKSRITLLARKYASSSIKIEDQARLDILNERIQRLIPSVSEAEVSNLEGIMQNVRRIRHEDAELRKMLESI